MQKRWNIRKHDADAVNKLAAELAVRPLIAALLIARGHDTAEEAASFLDPSPEHLHEPFLLKGMREAVDLCARLEGLLIDPVYTGKAMAGLIDLIRTGRFAASDTVVFIHTGGTPALFAYEDAVLADAGHP